MMHTCNEHVVNLYQQHWTCNNKIEVSKRTGISASVDVNLQLCRCI